MFIQLDPLSGKPMYEQIENSIRSSLLRGDLSEDEALPSVRQLAEDLNVSAITTKRVYADLEREGFLYTVAGKGTFIRHRSLERLKEESKKKLLEDFEEMISKVLLSGVSKEELKEFFLLCIAKC